MKKATNLPRCFSRSSRALTNCSKRLLSFSLKRISSGVLYQFLNFSCRSFFNRSCNLPTGVKRELNLE